MKLNLLAITTLDKKELKTVSEHDFSVAVREYAEGNGWKVHYQGRTGGFGRDGKTWRSNAPKGWPDLFMVRGKRAMALELKTQKGRPTEDQLEWLHLMAIANIETDVVKPEDAADIIERLKRDD